MPDAKIHAIEPAQLEWKLQHPYSSIFGDIYFSADNPIAESNYVFIEGNNCIERWQKLQQDHFVIAETGFGTGLNFLLACKAWLENTTTTQTLYYHSADKNPLLYSDLKRALKLFPELQEYTLELLKIYPSLVPGIHALHLFNGRVHLALAFKDVVEWLGDSEFLVDAWFLDGFAPAKNPDMWQKNILRKVSDHTKHLGTFSTFTAASIVRKNLQNAGFEVKKIPGYATKREMLIGTLHNQNLNTPKTAKQKPWFALPKHSPTDKKVTIIGGGLAGVFTADSLARRGWQITIIERGSQLFSGASGNLASVIFGKLSRFSGNEYQYYHSSYLYTVKHFPWLLGDNDIWQPCGVVHLAYSPKERLRQQEIIDSKVWPTEIVEPIDAMAATEITGISQQYGGLYFKKAGYISPRHVAEYLINKHKNINVIFNQAAIKLSHNDEHNWKVMSSDEHTLAQSANVVIANAADALAFSQTEDLPLHNIRGQETQLDATEHSAKLKTVVCYNGYIIPAIPNINSTLQHSVGSSYSIRDNEKEVRDSDNKSNIENLQLAIPELHNNPSHLNGRVGFRCHSPDHLPLIGPIPDKNFYHSEYRPLSRGQLKQEYTAAKYLAGLYLNVAHGSRGVTSTPLAAEIIAAYINGTPHPIPQSIRHALHPARHLIKSIKKSC